MVVLTTGGSALETILRVSADKPNCYLVKACDVGPPTDYQADYTWQSLKKEKEFA